MAGEKLSILGGFKKETSDLVMIVVVIGILLAMILPINPFILDFLLAMNITFAIVVLITTMYTEKPLDFSVFPSLLLVLTLFRLALNVASTRLILLHGNEGPLAAGAVISSFGNFVVGGNYVVGAIIFIILVLINFMVITKGSGRIAEVAARFTLDAMPGKQMAIDADLNAGIIDEDEARARRKEIGQESEFHGSMDGASKFVKGDAIAGIIITGINIVGGFVIGILQHGMDMATALSNYTLLTVGDGLVSQLPALIISTSAGLLVSRAGTENKMGKEFANHLFKRPMPVYLGSFVIFCLGLIPGLPAVPFISFALILGGSTYMYRRKLEDTPLDGDLPAMAEGEEDEEGAGPEEVEHLLAVDIMELEVGYGLIPLVDKQQDGILLGRIRSIRRQFATDMGMVVPPIHIRDNLKLKPSEYRVLIKGVDVAGAELMVSHLLAMDPGDVVQPIEGIPTVEPAFNLPALWIPEDREEDAKFAGYTVVDNSTVVATHITEIIRINAVELLGRQEVQHLLDNLSKTSSKAVEELIPALLPLGVLQKVLQNLIREKVSIRDLLSIVETLADYAPMSKDPDLLTEYVRQALSRSIITPFVVEGVLNVITLDRAVDDLLNKVLKHTEHGSYLALEPGVAERIVESVKEVSENVMAANLQTVILASPALRRHLSRLLEQAVPAAIVTSHAEVAQNISIKSVGKVTI